MSILDTLSKEHQLFRRLLDRLEKSLERPEEEAREELQEILLVLFPALNKHEEIESAVFDPEDYGREAGAKEILDFIERQHQSIGSLREEILQVLQGAERYSYEHLKSLVTLLVVGIRRHLDSEEIRLWPHYLRTVSRSLGHSMGRRAESLVKELERDIQQRELMISDYLRKGAR